ncbi:competence type IV pilus minor pilin ComGF [Staphylococcus pettenkoferi]|uniref:competence type IV pilus minor pilin ComGF n=1 Tax=Staphylococcus pettenkoferi TaxID=170573 RepID=UPI0009DAA235|nr:competence protein [Staphylococcus pettenkoferi]
MRSTINTKIYVSLIKKLKYAIRNNYKAFTYIELLLALTITIIILTILPLIINSTKFFDYHLSTNSDIELELFARDLIADFSTSPSLDIDNHSTSSSIFDSKGLCKYSYKNGKVIKTVNGKGNVTVLNQVTQFKVRKVTAHLIEVDIHLRDKGVMYHKQFYV